ncbi:hypothetical protein HO173_006986 [Letharia columbiana]|uniref:Uncharacterized protein n=1 Tax=Letharia columbiana TaxID=112416 RepID=A0A8H6FU58_9LECA|nr:uncharacterized protein HO173_006986 [Letharia columbiana]KAF6234766.1 hypothetical protein HO173_006986 [Letharia columbiana]
MGGWNETCHCPCPTITRAIDGRPGPAQYFEIVHVRNSLCGMCAFNSNIHQGGNKTIRSSTWPFEKPLRPDLDFNTASNEDSERLRISDYGPGLVQIMGWQWDEETKRDIMLC